MHVHKKAVIQNIEMAREVALSEFDSSEPEIVLKVARLIAAQGVKEELAEITGCLIHPLEIQAK